MVDGGETVLGRSWETKRLWKNTFFYIRLYTITISTDYSVWCIPWVWQKENNFASFSVGIEGSCPYGG